MNATRTLVSADWVVPVCARPVPDGAVLVAGETVEAVGPAAELAAAAPDASREHFAGGVLVPGLVNAHTHLSLTALEGAAPPSEFCEWLDALVPRIRTLDAEARVASAIRGVEKTLAAGITAVGDVTYRDESLAPAAERGLAGVFFREVLGVSGGEVPSMLEETDFLAPGGDPTGPRGDDGIPLAGPSQRVRLGLSAHAPYSTGPGAMRSVADIAREHGLPLMAHVAESPAEDVLVRRGTGRLASLAERLAPDFEAPGTGTVAYLDSLGILQDLVAIHAVQVDPTDIELLAEKARGVVLCPRSNLYLDCGAPPVRELREAGVTIALGTDSIASNRDFDLFEEARALREIDPGLTAEMLLETMTSVGAHILGLKGHGVLTAGGPADMTVLLLGGTDQPVRDVIGTARRKDVAAVMSAGVWRWRREHR